MLAFVGIAMAAFGSGNIVVYRVGTGAAGLTSASTAVFLDEYTPAGVLVQTIALPSMTGGATNPLTSSGSATSEGELTLSSDGSTLLVPGYDAAAGVAAIASTTAAADPREVGLVNAAGTLNISTILTGFESTNNIRSAASTNGNAIYAAGPSSSSGGVDYIVAGSTMPTSLNTTANVRQVEVVNGQLYYSTGSGAGIYTLGSGTPTTSGQTGTMLTGTGTGSNPYGFFFAKTSSASAGNDTLYIADQTAGIEKFSLQANGSWMANGTVAFSGVTGLTGSVTNGVVTLFATSPGAIGTLVDSSGQNGSISGGTVKTITSAATNEAFRGIAFTPGTVLNNTPATATSISIGDATYFNNAGGSEMETFTVSRSDTTGSFSFNYATANGSAQSGTDYTTTNGTLTFAAGGAASQTITVPLLNDATPPNPDTFTVNLSGLSNSSASFSRATATGTIVNPTPIYTIQGSGFTSPLNGQKVTTSGVVTALASNGYYLQDPNGDGNAATSDGLFVFTSSKPTVAVGDFEDVSGTVQEYPTNPTGGAFTTTELSSVTATNTVSQNNVLPAAVVIGPTGVLPPKTSNADADTFFESLEGMRVTVTAPVTIGPDDAQYGEIETFANNGANDTLNARGDALITLGQTSFGNTDTVGGNFNPDRIEIDGHLTPSGTTNYVPDVSVGTHFNDVTGILNYSFGQFGVSSTAPITVAQASTITRQVSTLVGDATHLTVGSYNIENFSAAYQGQAKVTAVAGDIVNNLKSPDIIALQEVQDDSGPTPDAGGAPNPNGDNGTTVATQNLAALVNAINAQEPNGVQYAAIDNPFIGNDTNGGQPGGNIRTAFIYRTDRVQFVQGSLATIAANGTAIHDMGSASADAAANMDQQTNNNNPFYASRPPLSANFTFNGQTVTVIDDHFTSKGGSGNIQGTVQPPFDGGEVQRAAQAQAENTYINSLLSANPNANVIATGDLNEFDNEEPLRVLEGTATISGYSVPAGASASTAATATYTANNNSPILTDLESTLPASQQYDYIFEGNAESLVHILSSNALTPNAQFQVVHINSEFADQTSDHEPEISSFAIAPTVTPCYVTGTLIRTARGDVAVEALAVGDIVVTASGEHRPIRWIGHRRTFCRNHPRPHEANPVRIRAHAFGDNRPARDLVVSPGHSICVDVCGEVLIPAVALVDGRTIVQQEVDSVVYWHVELENHDILLAENLPAESYLEMDNRAFFEESGVVSLHATPDARVTHADFCRPFHASGALVEAVRARLQARADEVENRSGDALVA